jgi:hypothetical protein
LSDLVSARATARPATDPHVPSVHRERAIFRHGPDSHHCMLGCCVGEPQAGVGRNTGPPAWCLIIRRCSAATKGAGRAHKSLANGRSIAYLRWSGTSESAEARCPVPTCWSHPIFRQGSAAMRRLAEERRPSFHGSR